MGLYREDEWKNSKENESSLKFNEEETAAGDQPLVKSRQNHWPGLAHKGAHGLCAWMFPGPECLPAAPSALTTSGHSGRAVGCGSFRSRLLHWRGL